MELTVGKRTSRLERDGLAQRRIEVPLACNMSSEFAPRSKKRSWVPI